MPTAFRKMLFLPSSILVLLYTIRSANLVAAQSSSSGTYTLPDDTSNFIPVCAQTCFTSFIESNYPVDVCSSSPSLDCLCSHNSTSGYTAGEGAVQCVISEDNVGFCQGENATSSVVSRVYNMCFGRRGALPNTHATITATLLVQSSIPTVIVVSKTSKHGSLPSSIPPVTLASTTGGLVTATGKPSGYLSLGITSTPTAQGSTKTPSPQDAPGPLTPGQIAGISVGGGTVVVLAIGGLVLFGCLRRKRVIEDDGESDFGNSPDEHGNSMERFFRGNDKKGPMTLAPGGTSNGLAARVIPQIPPRVMTDPNMFSRRSIPREEIGIALSPEMGKHPSKLLPKKPPLKLIVPPQSTISEEHGPFYPVLPLNEPNTEMPHHPRDSAMTQFEEDISPPNDFAKTPAYYDPRYAYPQRPVDDWGYWQDEQPPRSMTAPIEIAPKPLNVRKIQSQQSFSQPMQARTAASSVYSGHGSLPASEPDNTVWDVPVQNMQYKPYNPYAADGRESAASGTSMESAAQVEPRNMEPRNPDLSPVAGSPSGRSPVGRSPVSYPRIPARLSDQWKAPPKQPVFQPWRQPEVDAARKRLQSRPRRDPRDMGPRMKSPNAKSPPQNYSRANNEALRQNSDWPRHNRERSRSRGESPSTPISQRRGRGLGPALSLTGEKARQEGRWRVVNEDEPPRRASPRTVLTPQRIGRDLVLDVQKR